MLSLLPRCKLSLRISETINNAKLFKINYIKKDRDKNHKSLKPITKAVNMLYRVYRRGDLRLKCLMAKIC